MEQGFWEYLLVLSPDTHTNLRAKDIKSSFSEKYSCKFAKALKPHITLSNFCLYDSMEQRVLNNLEKVSKSVSPFNVEIDGFDHFLTHTIFLNIPSKKPIVDLVKTIRTKHRQDLIAEEKYKPVFCTTPHLTIARGMEPDQFEQAWPEWEHRKFHANFPAAKMDLIKRNLTKNSSYEFVRSFSFTGNDFIGKQLSLFN